jgi:hypothetical protein
VSPSPLFELSEESLRRIRRACSTVQVAVMSRSTLA